MAQELLECNVTFSYGNKLNGGSQKIYMDKLHPYKTTAYIWYGNIVNHRFENQDKMGGECDPQGDFKFS